MRYATEKIETTRAIDFNEINVGKLTVISTRIRKYSSERRRCEGLKISDTSITFFF